MHYADFTIRAREWRDGRFKVEVTQSPMDRMREPDSVSYPATIARLLRNLERKQIPPTDLKVLGTIMAELLLPPTVRQLFSCSLASLDRDQGLRLRLVLDDLRVANLPWEYMYLPHVNGEDGRYGFLALDPRISIVRHEAIPIAPGSVAARLPLKLVVGFASPAQFLKLDLVAERHYIEQALDGVPNIEVTFVERLTVQKLERVCQGAHMFHFAGHGGFLWEDHGQNRGSGAIFLEDADGNTQPFPVEKLALTLRVAGVRVVVMGGCETGRRDGVNAWSGVAPALMRVGIPAAVAMQYTVYDDAAIAFARRFYQALSVGLSLDEAVVAGRLAILNFGSHYDVDWGVPVLYMRSSDGVVFPEMTADPSLERLRAGQRVQVYQRAKELRDRMTGLEVGEAPASGVEVNQDIAAVATGGEALGARIEKVMCGAIKSDQKVDVVGPGGRVTGVNVRQLGRPQ
jgi:hypothetical protein